MYQRNSESISKDDYLRCPFDPSHLIMVKRFPYHFSRCRQKHKNEGFVNCPYCCVHAIRSENYDKHIYVECDFYKQFIRDNIEIFSDKKNNMNYSISNDSINQDKNSDSGDCKNNKSDSCTQIYLRPLHVSKYSNPSIKTIQQNLDKSLVRALYGIDNLFM